MLQTRVPIVISEVGEKGVIEHLLPAVIRKGRVAAIAVYGNADVPGLRTHRQQYAVLAITQSQRVFLKDILREIKNILVAVDREIRKQQSVNTAAVFIGKVLGGILQRGKLLRCQDAAKVGNGCALCYGGACRQRRYSEAQG